MRKINLNRRKEMTTITELKTTVLKRDIKRRLSTIQTGIKTAIGGAWDAGELLTELKERMNYGEWLPYLASIGLGERQAQKYMRLSNELDRATAIENKTINKALEGIASKEEKKESSTSSGSGSKKKENEYIKLDKYTYSKFKVLTSYAIKFADKADDKTREEIVDANNFLVSIFDCE